MTVMHDLYQSITTGHRIGTQRISKGKNNLILRTNATLTWLSLNESVNINYVRWHFPSFPLRGYSVTHLETWESFWIPPP